MSRGPWKRNLEAPLDDALKTIPRREKEWLIAQLRESKVIGTGAAQRISLPKTWDPDYVDRFRRATGDQGGVSVEMRDGRAYFWPYILGPKRIAVLERRGMWPQAQREAGVKTPAARPGRPDQLAAALGPILGRPKHLGMGPKERRRQAEAHAASRKEGER